MGLLVVALVTVVAALGMILFAVHKIRPRSLRFKATAARWLSLSLEIEAPERSRPPHGSSHSRPSAGP
jgi:hypothetical protein